MMTVAVATQHKKRDFFFQLILLSISLSTRSFSRVEAFSAFDVSTSRSQIHARRPQNQHHNADHGHHHPFTTTDRPTMLARASSEALFGTSGGGGNDAATAPPSSFTRQLWAEAVGTFLIVHLGCGTVCSAIYLSAQVGLWQIAAVWSLAVTVAIYCTASISGAHLNPAVTIALATLRGRDAPMSLFKVASYIVAQLSGAVLGAALNLALFWESIATFEATKGIVRGTAESVASAAAFGEYWSVSSWLPALLAETSGTCLLSFVIFSLTHRNNAAVSPHLIPAVIGGTVGALISVLAPLTQAGFNPARDFGPRIVAMFGGWGRGVAMQGWWVYVLGPIVGALLGGILADKVLWADEQ